MFLQNQIGTMAIIKSPNIPIIKRCIWGCAQRSKTPPDTENNIAKPIDEIMISKKIIGQFKAKIFLNPVGTDFMLYSR